MERSARPPFFVRLGNVITTLLLKRGVRLRSNTLLTVPGRKSGLPRTTPVTVIEYDGRRYIQSPFGETDWVRNLRAAGAATLTHGRQRETVAAIELSPAEAAPVLRQAVTMAPGMIRAYFDVGPDAPLDAFAREAPRHPTFELVAGTAETTATAGARTAGSAGV